MVARSNVLEKTSSKEQIPSRSDESVELNPSRDLLVKEQSRRWCNEVPTYQGRVHPSSDIRYLPYIGIHTYGCMYMTEDIDGC